MLLYGPEYPGIGQPRKMRLDGDFIRMNTYSNDSERRTVASTHLMAGGPVGITVVKLTQVPSTCRPQSIRFKPIPDWNYPSPPPNVSATATSGLPVQFEVAFGPATVVNSQVQPTAQTGTVSVVARQPGDANNCAAIPQLRSFNATGIHQSDMFLFGTFTNWTPWRMKLVNGTWVGDKVWVPAGMQQYKFADTNNFSGADWGNGQGLSGTSTVTTGGGPNSQFTAPERRILQRYFR